MLDINKKALKYLKNNLQDLIPSLTNREAIMKITLDSSTSPWDLNIVFNLYKELTLEILTNFDISLIILELEFTRDYYQREQNANISLFYSIIIRYLDFLKSIYEVYLLDQIFYLLKNCPQNYNFKPIKTGSYYEEINFGFTLSQISFSNFQDEYKIFEQELYNLKLWYTTNIKKILQSPGEAQTLLLKDLATKIVWENNEFDYYKVNLLSLLTKLKEEVAITKNNHPRKRKKRNNDNNQTTLY